MRNDDKTNKTQNIGGVCFFDKKNQFFGGAADNFAIPISRGVLKNENICGRGRIGRNIRAKSFLVEEDIWTSKVKTALKIRGKTEFEQDYSSGNMSQSVRQLSPCENENDFSNFAVRTRIAGRKIKDIR